VGTVRGRLPTANPSWSRPLAGGRGSAAGLLPGASPDTDQLTLAIPGDGSVASLRRVLDKLDHAGVDVEQLSIHTPDLDDVFFAVTGHTTTESTVRQEEEALQR